MMKRMFVFKMLILFLIAVIGLALYANPALYSLFSEGLTDTQYLHLDLNNFTDIYLLSESDDGIIVRVPSMRCPRC